MEIIENILTWHLIGYGTGVLLMFFQSQSYMAVLNFYWHYSVAHKQYTIVPWFQHVLRFWQWINSTLWYQGSLTTYTAIHRLHHMYTDTDRDPVSPHRFSLKELWTYEQRPGAARYISPEDIEKYCDPTVEPNDPATMFYKRHQFRGIWISVLIWTVILGPVGFVLARLMPLWNQYFGTFLGDWFYHKFGYKNPAHKGEARNFSPVVITSGLHSNHHAYPNKTNKAERWFEFDLFYYGCVLLSWLKIIKFTNISYTKDSEP